MGAKRTRSNSESDDGYKLSVPPGFESLMSFTLKKVKNSEEACNSVALGSGFAQGPSLVAATSTIISTGKLKSSVRHRPWILDDHVDHIEDDSEFEDDKSLSSSAFLPKGVIRGCSSCHNCQKVIARCRPELARIPSLEEAPVFHPSEEEFEDTLKYVASILPHVKHYGICRIVPPSSWKPPSRIEEPSTVYGVNTHIQRTSDLQNLFFKKRLEGACTRTNNKQQKTLSGKSDFGHDIERKEFGCCNEHFEFENGPKLMLKYFKHYADHFKKQYFVKEDQITASEPSIQDIEGEYWRIIENPTEEIEVLQGTSAEIKATESSFPHEGDVTSRRPPQYVESGWNLNNTPKLQDSLLRFGSRESSSILLPRLSIGMCFSSNLWRIEEHHLYLLSYIHFGAPKIFYGVPGSYRCKFEEAVKKHLPQLSAHPCLLQNIAFQFSPSVLTSEGIPVYRCVQNPKEFVLLLPGAYHAHADSGFNCSEAVNFAPFDWLPHGQNAVELYSEQGRKTSISYDKLLFEAATEGIRALPELPLLHKNFFDNLKWRAVYRSNEILTKALKSRVSTEVRRRTYLCASLESRKMEDDFCATTKRECPICYYDLYLSAIGCKCSPHKYTCLLHAKQLCPCAWSEKYLLIRYEIDELNIMVEALDGKVSAVHKWAKEKLGLPVSDVFKDASKDGMKVKSESGQSLDIEQDRKEEVSIPSVGPSARTNNVNRVSGSWVEADGSSHRPQSKGIINDKIEVLFPKISQHATVGKNIMTSSNTVLKKHLARESSSTKRSVIILSDDEN
ncbi:putative lysine-specific demethylase JMJ16 [Nicotiana sylvestris]|uniref:Lysine-specific demethylase JMJ16 n=1 Tax=Nicotiana sylvestris TaxID=4096 RepID=A0A1U7YLB9_NICSY|nr:PREDICTED: putative lysine-specific demethylase JMJ16 [Nicotiana sylvestris]XP_009803914.1 PREDICTED: putative lysine-specific demethylase JMJ16 [Nicotiana sylvestris]